MDTFVCVRQGCKNLKKFGSNVCHEHVCKYAEWSYCDEYTTAICENDAQENSNACAKHCCLKQKCLNVRQWKKEYCEFHNCDDFWLA